MKPINGFQSQAPGASYPMLPKGAYVCGIQDVKITGAEPNQQLSLRLEIIEGPYAGYWTKRYQSESNRTGMATQYETRYKGVVNIQIPNEANTSRQHYDWDLNTFNRAIGAIEASNNGYHWDWNEQGLKGKTVGVSVQLGLFNGIEFTSPRRLEDANQVREGKVKPMKDREPSYSEDQHGNNSGFTMVETDEIPF